MAVPLFSPGDIIAGKYRVESLLGEGGMGVVLGARNIRLDEPVAIKVLKPDAASDEEAVARFFREARAAVRMKGEHVAKVLDVGALQEGTPYMLMELLEGADLSIVIERYGWMPIPTAVDYVLQTCEALAEAHALGIVHRDIKPSNLFLTTGVDGSACIKVLDFGISKATNAIDAARPDFGLTQTQTVMGSPQYMAPEQMRSSRRVDGRTDIWGLGTILYELLTGAPPFVASSMPELFAMILQDPAPRLRERRHDIPPAFDDVVLRCLEKSPDRRPANVLELAHLLAPFASPLSAGAADRVARVGRNVAIASERNIANVGRLRESSPDHGAAPPFAIVPPAAAGSQPSAPELAHVHTTRMRAPRGRAALVISVAAVATLVLGGVTAGAIVMVRARNAAAAHENDGVTATTTTTAAAEIPPAAVELPATPSGEPQATAESAPPPSAASSTASAAPPSGKRVATGPGLRSTAPSAAASERREAPPPSAARTAAPPPPAATASSRYD